MKAGEEAGADADVAELEKKRSAVKYNKKRKAQRKAQAAATKRAATKRAL